MLEKEGSIYFKMFSTRNERYKLITERKNDLTYREMEILNFIVEGKSNPEISEALSISLNTVKAHCKSIFEKLNVDSRVDAAVKAILSGLVWL